jgi:hypothetical protein
LEQFENESISSKLSVLEAILFIRESWQEDVTAITITNCFRHVKIRDEEVVTEVAKSDDIEEEGEVIAAISQDIRLLRYRHPMKVDDFLNPENENVIDEQFTDEEIVELVCSSREIEENDIENKDDSSELLPVSIKEATESLDILVRFFLGQEGNYSKEINSLMKIQHVLRILKVRSLVQTSLNDYLVRNEV